jgi:DNA-binding NtrC family response regulator
MAESGEPLILLLDSDLFFVVKVRTTLQHAGYSVQTARTVGDFTRRLTSGTSESPALALVNTAIAGEDWRSAITAARAANIPVIAFGSHVDLETQQQAREAGATRVIANSKLAADLPGIVARTLRAPSQTPYTSDSAPTGES